MTHWKDKGNTMAKGLYKEWLTEDGQNLLRGWARQGATDEQIAKNIGINVATLYTWKNKYNEINNALKKNKEAYDNEIEEALHRFGSEGWVVIEETEELKPDPETGEFRMFVTKRVKKTVPPNATAMLFWLKNRQPDRWREKREEDIKTDNTISVAFARELEDYAD